MLNPKQEAEIFRRLDAQAAAIRDLRKEIAALKAGSDRSIPVESRTYTGSPGSFVPNPRCCICGNAKPPSRYELTCKPCGSEYQRQIKSGEPPKFATCANCGTAKAATAKMLCGPCSKGYREWKGGAR